MAMPRKNRLNCLNCGKETARAGYKYCSNACQRKHEYECYIKSWKEEKVSGIINPGVVSGHVKRYLRDKFGNKCYVCGWSKINPITNLVPLVADHIDGNWRNNRENNLRLICPNCDSLTSTYAGLNRGNGRKHRVVSNRIKKSRMLLKNKPK